MRDRQIFPLFISKLEKLVEYLFLMLWANRTTQFGKINFLECFWSVQRRKITLFGFGLLLLCEVLLCTHGRLVVVVVWFLRLIQLFASPWSAACQSPLSIGFPRKEYWCGLQFPSPGDLPDSGIEPVSSALQEDFFFYCWATGKAPTQQANHSIFISIWTRAIGADSLLSTPSPKYSLK